MKIVSLPRRSGKTTEAIMESAKTGKYILVMNREQAKMIADMARKLDIKIPFPVTVQELRDGSSIQEVIVDEAGTMLEHLIRKKITMMTVTDEES